MQTYHPNSCVKSPNLAVTSSSPGSESSQTTMQEKSTAQSNWLHRATVNATSLQLDCHGPRGFLSSFVAMRTRKNYRSVFFVRAM